MIIQRAESTGFTAAEDKMRDPRKILPISPELLRRSVDLEISIGAYSRRQRRRRWFIGVMGALLIFGAGWVYWELRPNHGPGSDDYPVLIECTKCGARSQVRIAVRQSEQPILCPVCKTKSGQALLKCRNCDNLFRSNASAGQVRCPRCGSLNVGSPMSPSAASAPVSAGP